VEALLASEDHVASARHVLDWLGAFAGVRRGLYAAVDIEAGRLVGVTGLGLGTEAATRFSVALDDASHPLVAAVRGARPVVLREGRLARTVHPLGAGPLLALPLAAPETEGAGEGLLLLATPAANGMLHDATWAAETLGKSFARLNSPRLLAEGERRFRRERTLLYSIINAVPDPIVLTDTEGRMVVANARAEALFAVREDASEGRRRAVALNNMFFSAALSRTAIDDPVSVRGELLLVDPTDGSDLVFELLSAVVNDPREGTGVVSILHDVTDLRRAMQEIEDNYRRLRVAEADVRAERDRLNLIIDAAADPILVTDPAGNIELMNRPAERLFTVDDAQTAGVEAERRVQSNDAHVSSFVVNLYGTPGLTRKGELSLLDPASGASLPFEAVVGQVLSDRGEVVAVVTILHDRSEAVEKARLYDQLQRLSEDLKVRVREATAELAEQNELLRRQALALEQASALKTQFLANMSHELRTPLNAILGYTNMLMQGVYGPMAEPQHRSLGRVDSNARHLLSIINDLLDITRIEAGRMPMEVEETSVADIVVEVMTEMEPIIARSRLSVEAHASPDIPTLSTDRKKLKQITMNLMANALKFTPQGSVRLSAAFDQTQDEVTIAVADTGIGIAQKDFEKIFEDFRQVDDSTTRRYPGTGLGLAICRRLAAMLNGRISLTSALGRGSTFMLHLPRRTRTS
jgi:PAS domain S-box-containing protein